MTKSQRNIIFPNGDIKLEGVLHLPSDGDSLPAVAICHPHPRHGGDMDNVVVSSLVGYLGEAGIAALRFNFRGVGLSGGSFDGGSGEISDAVEALSFLSLQDEVDPTRIGLMGYSYGAAVALIASTYGEVTQAVASVACPSRVFSDMGAHEMLQPKLLVCGEFDHDFPAAQFSFLAKRFSDPKQIELIHGADHFFGDFLDLVGELAGNFFQEWLCER